MQLIKKQIIENMKKTILFFTVLCLSAKIFGQGNAVDEMFRKYSDKDGFTLVTISSRMFSMIANLDPENENKDADDIIHRLNSIRILSVSDSLLNKNINFYSELSRKLDLSVYEELMVVKEGQSVTKILIRPSGDKIGELLLISGGPGGNSLISIKGDLSMKNISDLSRSMNIRELEGLEKQEKKKQKE